MPFSEKLWFRWFLACLLFSLSLSAKPLLQAVSEEYEGGCHADGSGYYFDLIRLVFLDDYEVKTSTIPYARAVHSVLSGKADLWVGSYADEVEEANYPLTAIDFDEVQALYDPKRLAQAWNPGTFRDKKLAWVRGYGYHEYFPQLSEATFYELKDLEQGIRMLQSKRIDAVIDAKVEIDLLAEQTDLSVFKRLNIGNLYLYMGFKPGPEGKKLAALWDKRVSEKSDAILQLIRNTGYVSYHPSLGHLK